MDPTPAEIAKCREPRLSYLAWHADAKRRHKRGERQVYCRFCQRWQWRDQLCAKAMHALAQETKKE